MTISGGNWHARPHAREEKAPAELPGHRVAHMFGQLTQRQPKAFATVQPLPHLFASIHANDRRDSRPDVHACRA